MSYGFKSIGRLLTFLPLALRIQLAKQHYYKLRNSYVKHFAFHFLNASLKDLKKDIYVTRDYIYIKDKKLNYKLRLNLRSFVGRLFLYKDNNDDLGLLITKLLDTKSTYADIGANIGQTALMAASVCKQVYAFEPVPSALKELKSNIKLNNFNNVKVHDFALSNKNSTAKISLSDENDGSHSLDSNFQKYTQNKYVRQISIKTKKFDSLKLKVDMVKIDVEGHELSVLKGMTSSIKNTKYVVLETTPLYYQDVLDFFDNHNFTQIKEYGDYNNGIMNLLFVNKSKVKNLNKVRSIAKCV